MTREEVVAHWQKGAKDALEMAELALNAGKYDHVLFNCHLALEKALKATYIAEHDRDHRHTHDLVSLSLELSIKFDKETVSFLEDMTEYAIDARYNDTVWAAAIATMENATSVLKETTAFLTLLFHAA